MANMPDGLGRFRNSVPPTSDERKHVTPGVDDAPDSQHPEPKPPQNILPDDGPPPTDPTPASELPSGVNALDPSVMADALIQQMGKPADTGVPGPTSLEVKADAHAEPDPGMQSPVDPDVQAGLAALYGDEFPLLKPDPNDDDAWVTWAKGLWTKHRSGVQTRLHLVERNRLFRSGVQWISSSGMGPWREPPKPRDAARIVDNMVKPALDQRVNLVIEQRPGFRAKPTTQDQDDLKRAEAAQNALEYQWDQQRMGGANGISAEAAYWSGTDGVAFLELGWDPDRGQEHHSEEVQDGQGNVLAPAFHGHLGDVKTIVRRIEQVRVSAEATATQKPWYWIVRDTMPTAQAVKEYGAAVVKNLPANGSHDEDYRLASSAPLQKGGYLLPDLEELIRDQPTVDRYTVYCEGSGYLPGGLQMTAVGSALVVRPMPLVCGRVPMVRWADGSTDPAFYPEPIMDQWIDPQMRQNALWSKWVEGIRKMAGVNLLARKGSITTDSLKGGVMNVINVEGSVDVNSVVRELGNFSMSSDVKEALAANQKRFEDLSGWSDASRGSFDQGESGRSILAQREVTERIFAPPINAAAHAMTEWGEITLAFIRWGYDIPRMISVEGKSRQDLGVALHSSDLDGITHVWLDPETLMPMPRALKLFMLDQLADKQMISPDEYRRRIPFAFVQNLDTPDLDHFARAKRIVQAILQTGNPMPYPIRWQDNEAIHQDALEREIILRDDLPEPIVQAAIQRWQMLAQQAQAKNPPPMMGPGAPAGPGGPHVGPAMDPRMQPTLGSSPPVAANALARIGGSGDAEAEARGFDARTAA